MQTTTRLLTLLPGAETLYLVALVVPRRAGLASLLGVVVVRISDVLQRKGPDVTTLDASATVRDLVEVLAERSIGAVIVSADGRSPAGMVSERDVVRRLQSSAEGLLEQTLASIMTADVVVCGPQDQVDSVLQLMTERRIRHVPVIEDAQVVGLVSIGDLVKSRIDELRLERDQLSNYISGSA